MQSLIVPFPMTDKSIQNRKLDTISIPAIHRIEEHYKFVYTESVCNRQKDSWQKIQTIYFLVSIKS